MLTKNNWLKNNIKDRVKIENRLLPLEVILTPTKIESSNFTDAVNGVLEELSNINEKLILSFSGGVDSDFVFHKLIEWGIPFEPLIVFFQANTVESQFAFHSCKKFGITPTVIEVSEKKFLKEYHTRVVEVFGGDGFYSVPSLLAADYAKEKDKKLLTGQDFITGDHKSCSMGFNVYDFYVDLVDEELEIPFFLYNTDIVYEATKRFDSNISVSEWKHELFEILSFRAKVEHHKITPESVNYLMVYLGKVRQHYNNDGIDVINKDKILAALENTGEEIILNANYTY